MVPITDVSAPRGRAAGRVRALGFALGLLAAVPAARACGVCLEDKMAATYDAAVMKRARACGHAVGFAALTGPGLPMSARAGREVRRWLEAVPGVDAGSVRVSAEHAAAAFAFDPSRHTLTGLLAGARPRLARLGLDADSIRVLSAGGSRAAAGVPASAAATAARRTSSFAGQVGALRAR